MITRPLKKRLIAAFTFAALSTIGHAHASEEIAKQNGCFGCHAIDEKVMGPSFKEVAKKYAGQGDAALKVAETIRKGSTGTWGKIPMPAQEHINAEVAKSLASWVLATKTQ
jgi:cytochrome c